MKPVRNLELTGMLSLADWRWNSRATGYLYNDQGIPLTKDGVIIRKSKFPPNPERSVQFSGKRTKRSVQKKGCTQHL